MPKTPAYRKRSGYDQAIVTLTDAVTKRRRDYWLGEYGTPASRERYHRLIAAWEAGGRRHPDRIDAGIERGPSAQAEAADGRPTVAMVIAACWRWAQRYYQHRVGTNRALDTERAVGDRYTTPSYYVAIRRACDRAFPPPPPLGRREDETLAEWRARLTPKQKADLAAWQKAHRWHPHQLRHTAATEIRRAFGLEAAQLALGHSSAQVTDAVYAERDHGKVAEIMRQVG